LSGCTVGSFSRRAQLHELVSFIYISCSGEDLSNVVKHYPVLSKDTLGIDYL
jgi:hypothetical protein